MTATIVDWVCSAPGRELKVAHDGNNCVRFEIFRQEPCGKTVRAKNFVDVACLRDHGVLNLIFDSMLRTLDELAKD